MKKQFINSNQFKIILAIIIIILLVIIAYLLRKSESRYDQKMAHWKQYQSNNHSFKIGYPAEWKVIDLSDNALTVATSDECKNDDSPIEKLMEQYKQCSRFRIWTGDTVRANYSDDPNDYFLINYDGIQGERFIYNYPVQSTIDGQTVYIPMATISGQVAKDGMLYKFSLNFHQGNINQALHLFDDFVSTFQFANHQ